MRPYEVPHFRTAPVLARHHEGMDDRAPVELVSRDRWWVQLRPWLAVLAWIVGGLLVFLVGWNYALTPLYDIFAPSNVQGFTEVASLSGWVLWWSLVTTSVALAVLLMVCWPKEERPGRRALVMIGAGLVANWSWRLVDDWLDPWGIRSFTDTTPEMVRLATVDIIVSETITIVSAGLLIAGAVLVKRRGSKPESRA